MPNTPKKTKAQHKAGPSATTAKKESGTTKARAPRRWYAHAKDRASGLLARRPHRSFKMTRRRDYVRSLSLPGYWAFTGMVRKILWQHKRLFLGLAAVYAVLYAALVGLASQELYGQLSDSLNDISSDIFAGNVGELGKAGLLMGTALLGGITTEPTDIQRVYAAILGLLGWLTSVWLLRAILAGGNKPKLRDGLYSAGAPLFSTLLVSLLIVLQLLPVAIAVIAFGAAASTGILTGGVGMMLFWVAAALLGSLSLYWITTTFMALIVVTLPGMYPMQAIRTAGDLVVGRRLRILLRLLWLLILDFIVYALVMLPIVIFDTWLKSVLPAISWLPLVPIVMLVLSSLLVVWTAAYVYMLYRKVVDDDAKPA